jgi:polyvinyl alcohol dehydrogenase (cytochrome)
MWFQPALLTGRKSGRNRTRAARRPKRRKAAFPVAAVERLEDRMLLSAQAVDVVTGDPQDWPMYNHDSEGTRYNFAETVLSPDTVDDLGVVWRFETPGAIAGTPAVVNDVIYAADSTGAVYAVNRDGQELWQTVLPVASPFPLKLTASPLVTNHTLIIGDLSGQIHGLDVDNGEIRWTIRPPSPGPVFGDDHPFQGIFGSPTMVGNNVAIGITSFEEAAPLLVPGYPGFTFRGSLVLLDPGDGHIIWQTFTVDEATFQPDTGEFAPSGATIWSTPTYDRASNTIYATTGNNYSRPTTDTEDAILAFDASDGHIKWSTQMTTDDFWNYNYPPKDPGDPPDFDFGDSPQIYMLGGRKVVGAGQKSGFYHVVDAETGEIINQFQATSGGSLGGLYADSAVAGGVVFANGSDWPDPFSSIPDLGPYEGGSLTAIKGDGSGELWTFETPAPDISGVAVANGVVYFSSIDGSFYALNTADGSVLAQIDTSFQVGDATVTGVSSGPAVSRGRVYVGLGDTVSSLTNPFNVPAGGAILALGLPDTPHGRPQANTPPAFQNRSVTPLLQEGGTATLTGTIVDPDPIDIFFLDVNWGDANRTETFSFGPGAGGTTVNVTHRYADDAAEYDIAFSWRDQFDFGNSAVLTTKVDNVAPVVDAGGSAFLELGSTFSRTVSFVDPGADFWTATVDYGDGSGVQTLTIRRDKTFTLDHLYKKSGTYLVTVTVVDDEGATGVATFKVEVGDTAGTALTSREALFSDPSLFGVLDGSLQDELLSS